MCGQLPKHRGVRGVNLQERPKGARIDSTKNPNAHPPRTHKEIGKNSPFLPTRAHTRKSKKALSVFGHSRTHKELEKILSVCDHSYFCANFSRPIIPRRIPQSSSGSRLPAHPYSPPPARRCRGRCQSRAQPSPCRRVLLKGCQRYRAPRAGSISAHRLIFPCRMLPPSLSPWPLLVSFVGTFLSFSPSSTRPSRWRPLRVGPVSELHGGAPLVRLPREPDSVRVLPLPAALPLSSSLLLLPARKSQDLQWVETLAPVGRPTDASYRRIGLSPGELWWRSLASPWRAPCPTASFIVLMQCAASLTLHRRGVFLLLLRPRRGFPRSLSICLRLLDLSCCFAQPVGFCSVRILRPCPRFRLRPRTQSHHLLFGLFAFDERVP